MTSNQRPSQSIRSTIRDLEQQIRQARSRRLGEVQPVPATPSWASSPGSEQDTGTPRIKAQRKAPTHFSDNWNRKAG
jgi:hypothetical protein